jgi:iron-sulfur cluster repair protein YtfE (RIC family)
MKATDIFHRNHGIIRRTPACLDAAVLTGKRGWAIVARNVATYLDVELREYIGSEERWVFGPLAETGADAAGVVRELEREHRELEARLAEFKALAVRPDAGSAPAALREQGLALARAFLHHLFLEEEVGFVLAEQRLGEAYLEGAGDHVLLLKAAELGLEEPAAID